MKGMISDLRFDQKKNCFRNVTPITEAKVLTLSEQISTMVATLPGELFIKDPEAISRCIHALYDSQHSFSEKIGNEILLEPELELQRKKSYLFLTRQKEEQLDIGNKTSVWQKPLFHNISEEKVMYDKNTKPVLEVLLGCAGSGKTSVRIIYRFDEKRWPYHLNFDEYRQSLRSRLKNPIYQDMKLSSLPKEVFNKLNWATQSFLNTLSEKLIQNKTSFSLETTGDDCLYPVIRKAFAKGYLIQGAIVLTCDPEINIQRIRERAKLSKEGYTVVDQSIINEKEIIDNYRNLTSSVYRSLEMFTNCNIIDNSGATPRSIVQKKDGDFYVDEKAVSKEDAYKIIASLDNRYRVV